MNCRAEYVLLNVLDVGCFSCIHFSISSLVVLIITAVFLILVDPLATYTKFLTSGYPWLVMSINTKQTCSGCHVIFLFRDMSNYIFGLFTSFLFLFLAVTILSGNLAQCRSL